jgi:hypothetical protein
MMAEELPQTVINHFRYTLRINTVDAYVEWCKKNGFTKPLKKKTFRDFKKEYAHYLELQRKQAIHVLSKNKIRNPQQLVSKWLDNYHSPKSKDLPNLPFQINSLSATLDLAYKDKVLEPTKRLIAHLHKVIPDSLFEKVSANKNFIDVLPGIAFFEEEYLRSPEEWKPTTHNTDRQFASFLRHLFAKYSIPKFMDSCWFFNSVREHGWYVHLGTGQNIRTAPGLFFPLTKKQSHHFYNAPNSCPIYAAFRYGQIISYDGNERVLNALIPTKICDPRSFVKEEDEFWQSVIRWFISNPMLDTSQFGPIIDWIQNQKYEPQHEYIGEGNFVDHPPPQPYLSMKKRDPMATLKAMESWHKQLGQEKKAGIAWKSSGIKGLTLKEGINENAQYWKIHELCSTKELREEGKAMSHCVGSYDHSCASGRKSIWSLTCQRQQHVFRHLTIEVHNGIKTIIQARGRFNVLPTEKEKGILAKWCTKSGLSLSLDRYL